MENTNDIAIIPQDDIEFVGIKVKQIFKILGKYDPHLMQTLDLSNVDNFKFE